MWGQLHCHPLEWILLELQQLLTLRATTGIVTSLTAGSLTSLGAVSGTTGTFSAAVSGTTGTFTGDVDIADKIAHTGDTDTAIRFPSANTISFEANGSERVRINADGKFGIGTNDPVRPLHIHAADCRIRLEDAGVATDVELQNSSGDAVLTTNGASNLRLQTDNTERLRIKSDGKVGIGTNNPTDPLHVYHASDNFIGRFESGDAGGGIVLKDPTHSTTLITNDGDFTINVDNGGDVTGESIRFEMSGSEKVRITSAGRVQVKNGTINLGTADTSSGHINSAEVLTFNIDTDNDDTNRYFAFYKNGSDGSGTELVRIKEDGNVGIGTDYNINEYYKLIARCCRI